MLRVRIPATRLSGIALGLLGLAIAGGRLHSDFPDWLGFVLIAMGLIDVALMPTLLARSSRGTR